MSTLQEVSTSAILKKALSIIQSAKVEVLVTMDLAEELAKPLPEEYFLQLQQTLNEGVSVKRLAFGSDSDFKKFNSRQVFTGLNYKCVLSRLHFYRRMMLVDRSLLMFAVEREGKRRFFFTQDKNVITAYLDYFVELLEKSE